MFTYYSKKYTERNVLHICLPSNTACVICSLPATPSTREPLCEGVRESVCVFVFRASFLHSRVAPHVNYEGVAAYLFSE